MQLYDVPERPLEPPDDVVVGHCTHCGGEIYKDEEIFTDGHAALHPDCLKDWIGEMDRETLMGVFGFRKAVAGSE